MTHDLPTTRRDRGMTMARPAFTLIEMLIVIGVVVVLLSILIVALNLAMRTSQSTNTRALMTSLKQSLVTFKTDIGYYPPILTNDDQRALDLGTVPGAANYDQLIQQWFSITSLAEYLVGWDERRYDGFGSTTLGEVPFTGIRHPGSSGAWGAAPLQPYTTRSPIPPEDGGPAQVYGPYLELDNPRLLGRLGADGRVYFRGDSGYNQLPADAPTVICDFWGEPIQYFRRLYPPGAIGQSYRSVDYDGDGTPDPVPTLSDVIRLRPFAIATGAATDAGVLDGNSDTSTTYELEAAEFAFFSTGADKAYVADERVDSVDEFNRDNIVEVGP